MINNNTIILVGFRSAAIKAALRLNLQVIIWSPNNLPKKYLKKITQLPVTEFPNTSLDFPTKILVSLKNKIISAVIATTEKAVIPAALLCAQLKLAGINVHTAEICRDKLQMKVAAQQAKIPITPFKLIKNDTTAEELVSNLHLPIVIKQRSSSGSRGLYVIHTKEELQRHIIPNHIAERFIHGIELSIESFVHAGKIIFHNFTEYYSDRAVNIIPAQLNPQMQQEIISFNQHVIASMGITSGITHLEVFITTEGLIFGEIAIRPPGGYLMNLIQLSYGFDAWEALLRLAVDAPVDFPQLIQTYSAVWIVHPGAGTVKTVKNLDKIAALPSVKKVSLRIKPGDTLRIREGAGQDYGHILFCSVSRANLIADIEQARQLLHIEFS